MFAIAFLICLGQLLAMAVHAGTWWLRKRALWSMAIVGFLCFALALTATLVLSSYDPFFQDSELTETQIEAARQTAEQAAREFIFYAILFYLGVSALGFYHSFLLGRSWRWTIWLGTTLAVWGELGIATFGGLKLENSSIAPLRQKFFGPIPNVVGHFFGYSWTFDWALQSFLITLLLLALFRPLLLKTVRGISNAIRNPAVNAL